MAAGGSLKQLVLAGLRSEESIAELCRREGIVQNLYYRWSKDFLEAGKKRLAGDTARAATSDDVKDLRREASALKEVVVARILGKACSSIASISDSSTSESDMNQRPRRGKAATSATASRSTNAPTD